MAKLICLLLLLRLTSLASAQVSNSTSSVSSASDAASSASDAASTASSLSSVGSSSAASSAASVASSISSVASSLSSVASSVLSEEPTTSTATFSSSTTATESSSSVAPPSSSSTPTSTPESTSSTFSPVTLESTSTSISYAPSTIPTTSVIPTTVNGVVGFSTVTTFVVSSAPATTYVNVSPYTTSELAPGADPTTQAGASQSGGGGGLSSGAKIGIGVGVGLAVLAAAIFGGWYSWYMRKRRRRSISASDRYPPSSLPSMIGMGGGAGAALGYADKSDTRSELPSPPIKGPMGGHNSPPLKSNHLVPVGAGVRSWNSVSNSNAPASNQSVSDYSERGGQPPGEASDTAGPGYFPPAVVARPVHEMGESQYKQGYTHQQMNPQQQYSHSRTISGTSQPSELGDGTGTLPAQHQRTLSGSTQQGHYQSPSIGSDGYWHDTQTAQELQGSPPYVQPSQRSVERPEGYRGVDPEVPLHQRMQTERVPVRPGHLQKPPPNLPPSHNY